MSPLRKTRWHVHRLFLSYFFLPYVTLQLHQNKRLPWCLRGKESTCNAGITGKRHRLDAWVGKIPWRREWHPTPVLLSGKSHGQTNLVGCVCGYKESDTTLGLNKQTKIKLTFSRNFPASSAAQLSPTRKGPTLTRHMSYLRPCIGHNRW